MARYLITLLFFQFAVTFSQVKHYQITQSNNLGISPYKVYNSNEGNLLLSNGEINWDASYSNLLKTKTNGDTIYIKSTDDEKIFVTSNGNILSNKCGFEIVLQNYNSSYITMRDKNLNVKWQIDLSSNFYLTGFYSKSPPIVNSFYELTPNKFICSVFTCSLAVVPSHSGLIIMEFDSSGTINSIRSNWLDAFCNLAGKFNNNWVGYDNSKIIIVNTTVLNNAQALKYNYMIPGLRSVCCKNNKIYAALQVTNGHKAVLSCFDTNLTMLWSKVIQPNDTTKYNYMENLLFYNNTLIAKYHDDTSSYILNFDTLGTLLSSNKILLNANEHITNLALVNDSVYTTKNNSNIGGVSLIRMNSQGQYPCSSPSNFMVYNNTITNYPVFADSLRPTSFSYSLSIGGNGGPTYTISLADDCIATGVDEKYSKNEDISVYPNPVNSVISIKIGESIAGIETYSVKITDILGREVMVCEFKEQLDITLLEKGIYFLSLYKSNEFIETKKIIKQ
jgi:hypothetical protein